MKPVIRKGGNMREEYDIDSLNPTKNPFAAVLNESRENSTVKLDDEVIDYFVAMSNEEKIPYQTLINLYLADCIKNHCRPTITWNKE